jgi:hypothetical protein
MGWTRTTMALSRLSMVGMIRSLHKIFSINSLPPSNGPRLAVPLAPTPRRSSFPVTRAHDQLSPKTLSYHGLVGPPYALSLPPPPWPPREHRWRCKAHRTWNRGGWLQRRQRFRAWTKSEAGPTRLAAAGRTLARKKLSLGWGGWLPALGNKVGLEGWPAGRRRTGGGGG